MAVKIRLKRMGAKRNPYYRIVVADSRRAGNSGAIIEQIGTFNPVSEPVELKLDEEAALKWLSNGAQPTDSVRDILSKQGVMKAFHESKLAK